MVNSVLGLLTEYVTLFIFLIVEGIMHMAVLFFIGYEIDEVVENIKSNQNINEASALIKAERAKIHFDICMYIAFPTALALVFSTLYLIEFQHLSIIPLTFRFVVIAAFAGVSVTSFRRFDSIVAELSKELADENNS